MQQIIPAIDLKNNLVIHARGGDRNAYRPLNTKLFPSPEPIDVITQLHHLYKLETFYLADLDAIVTPKDNNIANSENNHQSILDILQHFPNFSFWLDTGICTWQDYQQQTENYSACTAIVPTETLTDLELIPKLHREKEDYILSLDFKHKQLLGNPLIFKQAQLWPKIVIALTLDAVGSRILDCSNLITVRTYNQQCMIVAGGGISNMQDLKKIASNGSDMALLASALYTGKLITNV